MELLTDDIPDFMAPPVPPETTTPEQTVKPEEPEITDLSTLQGLIVIEVAAQLQAQPKATPSLLASNEGRIMATAPSGFTITLIARKETPGEVLTALTIMEQWLIASGYQPL